MIFFLTIFLLLASPARAQVAPEIEVTNLEYRVVEKK